MVYKISKKLSWIKENPLLLKGILRGIERETLRIQKNGIFSSIKHPYVIGSSLTHKWITTDFAENLLEFITPKNNNVNYTLNFLHDLHTFVTYNTKNERMWPFSMPYFLDDIQKIRIAEYGSSNIGKMKNLYRVGLKNRYGDITNTISGIHYNFSLPVLFWNQWRKKTDNNKKEQISSGYLHLIRNYYRFGWIIPYLFGASPAISSLSLRNSSDQKFKKNKYNDLYLPWATSLRLSDIGYTSTSIIDLNIMFNDLNSYIKELQRAIKTPSNKFSKIALTDHNGNLKQLNPNILQKENELYTQIRPKTTLKNNESLIEALTNRGIEYVEIRSLDVNPFSPIGINKKQILLLDLFLIWCALIDSPKMKKIDFLLIHKNWSRIILEGRKPKQKIYVDSQTEKTVIEIGKSIFKDLEKIAKILDSLSNNQSYQDVCHEKFLYFKHPELTYSAKCLNLFIKDGIKETGLTLATKYYKNYLNTPFSLLNERIFKKETIRSHNEQSQIEKKDTLSFEEYLKKHQ